MLKNDDLHISIVAKINYPLLVKTNIDNGNHAIKDCFINEDKTRISKNDTDVITTKEKSC